MSQPAQKAEEAVDSFVKKVGKLFPDAGTEFLEDVFDTLTVARAKHDPIRPLDEVLEDLDNRHGITR